MPHKFDDAAFRSKIALENCQSAGRLERLVRRADHILPRSFLRFVGFFADGARAGRHSGAIEHSQVRQTLGEQAGAAGGRVIGCHVASAGLQVAKQRHLGKNPVEIVHA